MAKVYLICGRICCGKSTYAKRLQAEKNAVVLSVDEIMLAIFGLYAGERHDEYAAGVRKYLFEKSLELIGAGVGVILDWGFWTRAGRQEAKAFYERRGVECALHYVDVREDVWRARIAERNRVVAAGKAAAYIVDDNLAAKFASRFEAPGDEEIDLRVEG